jgi:hypothetical protein
MVGVMWKMDTTAYRPVAKRWFCKQRPLLDNGRNIHARNNKTTALCNPFLSNGSVNTFPRKRMHITVQLQWKRGCFLCGPCRGVKKKTNGAGVEYLHRDPASCRRRRKGKSQIWDSKIRSRRWQGPAAYTKDRPVLSSETAPHKNKTVTVKQ